MFDRLTRHVEVIRKKYLMRMDADDGEKGKSGDSTGLATHLPYALCEEVGIDTEGMTPREAWDAYKGKTGADPGSVIEEKASQENDRIDPDTGESEGDKTEEGAENNAASSEGSKDVNFSYKNKTMQEYAEKVPKASMDTSIESLKGWEQKTAEFADEKFEKDGEVLGCKNAEELEEFRGKVQAIFDNTEICSQVDSVNLKSILEGGLKNQFETGTTNGSSNLEARKDAAESLFGTSRDAEANSREKYGFIADKEDFESQLGEHSPGYGDVCLTLKKDKMANRTTYTAEDSLFDAGNDTRAGTHNHAAGAYDTNCTPEGFSFSDKATEKIKSGEYKCVKDMLWTVDPDGISYVEAQFHGDVNPSDIESIKFSGFRDVVMATKNWDENTWGILKDNNINIVYFDNDRKQKTLSAEEAIDYFS